RFLRSSDWLLRRGGCGLGGRCWCRPVHRRPYLNLDREQQWPDLQAVLVVQLGLSLDLDVVDERPVGGVEVADEDLAVALDHGTMPLADGRAGRTQVTLWVPA